MASKFWLNVYSRLKEMNQTHSWLEKEAKFSKGCHEKGKARESSPSADRAYTIAKLLNISIEELVDGENGKIFLHELLLNDSDFGLITEKYYQLIECLPYLSKKEYRGLLAQALELTSDVDKKGKFPLIIKRPG